MLPATRRRAASDELPVHRESISPTRPAMPPKSEERKNIDRLITYAARCARDAVYYGVPVVAILLILVSKPRARLSALLSP
eukprot:tig00021127_g18781.t1